MQQLMLRIRLKLIGWLIGKLSIIANVTLDGSALVGSGLIANSNFVRVKMFEPGRINVLPGAYMTVADSMIEIDVRGNSAQEVRA